MKTELGVSVAVLATLAAHGKDLDRATLNAMLEKLAASPEPKIKNGPMAMCYKMALPVPVEVRHVCPKCETVTRFVSVCMKNDLAFLRDGAVALKGMGLDIALDESPLCRACTPGPKMPRAGRMSKATDSFAAGDEVIILRVEGGSAWVSPRKKRLHPEHAPHGLEMRGLPVPLGELKDLTYGDGDFALEERFSKVSWVINGKRTPARKTDVELLKTFLAGKLVLKEGRCEEVPLKRRIDRLRELLGVPKK